MNKTINKTVEEFTKHILLKGKVLDAVCTTIPMNATDEEIDAALKKHDDPKRKKIREELTKQVDDKCKWVEGQEFEGDYRLASSCGKTWASAAVFDENEYKFCPHCGKEIEVTPVPYG